MFPFLFSVVWRMLKGAREQNNQRDQRRLATDHNHNRNVNNGRTARGRAPYSQRKRKAYAVMFMALMGLFIPLAIVLTKRLLVTIYESSHDRIVWQMYRPDHGRIQSERLTNMQKYLKFQHNRTGVDKRERLSLREFVDVYDGKWPVVITDVVRKWRAFQWTDDFFIKNYGSEKVFVKNVVNGVESGDSVSLSYFLRHLDDGGPGRWRYLEDEHFLSTRSELRRDIGEHVYVLDDFFRDFPDSIRPWDSMLLWGSAHSRSPLHIDPYNWTGLNAVLRGHKKWKLYPPGQDAVMYVVEGQRCHFPLDCVKYNSRVDAFDPGRFHRFPKFSEARYVEVDQYPGDLLFIPTGWFHQAYNVVPTLAISGQLMNDQNYMTVLEEILRANPIPVHDLPSTFYSLSSEDQVRIILSRIPRSLHKRGEEITEKARKSHG